MPMSKIACSSSFSFDSTHVRFDVRLIITYCFNHKNYNFLDCDWFEKLLFFANSLAKLLSDSLLLDSLLLDSLLLDSLLSDSSISQSHSKL